MAITLVAAVYKMAPRSISPTHRAVLLYLAWRVIEDKGKYRPAYPSVRTICRETSLTERTVQTALQKLLERGFIKDTGHSYRRAKRYDVVIERIRECAIVLQDSAGDAEYIAGDAESQGGDSAPAALDSAPAALDSAGAAPNRDLKGFDRDRASRFMALGSLSSTISTSTPLPPFATAKGGRPRRLTRAERKAAERRLAYEPHECPHEPKCGGRWRCHQRTQLDAMKAELAVAH